MCNLFQVLVSRVTVQVATSGVDDRLMCVSNRDDETLSAYVKLDVLFLSLFFPPSFLSTSFVGPVDLLVCSGLH